MKRNAKGAGYTLVELMTVLAIASILMLVALPAFQTQMRNARMASAATDLLSTFMNARAEASGRANFVTVCKRNTNGTDCVDGEDDDWNLGWITFVDEDSDGVIDAGEQILQVHSELDDELRAIATGNLEHRITYRPNGLTNLTGTETVIFCDARGFRNDGVHTKALVVSLLGKASVMNAKQSNVNSCDPGA